MNVGVHQGSVLSPLLFIIVMEAVTHTVRECLPWEILYADDLILVEKCEEKLKEKLRKWNECLSGLLIGKGMSLRAKGIIYTTCIRPAMLYGSETWPTKIEDIRKIQRSKMRMLRWMTGVSLSEKKSNECVRSMLAIYDIAEVMQ